MSSTSLDTKILNLKASQIESKIQIFAIEKRTALNKKLHQAFLNLKMILIYLRNGIATTVIDSSGMDNFSRELHISARAGVKTDLLVLPFSREHEKTCLKQWSTLKISHTKLSSSMKGFSMQQRSCVGNSFYVDSWRYCATVLKNV